MAYVKKIAGSDRMKINGFLRHASMRFFRTRKGMVMTPMHRMIVAMTLALTAFTPAFAGSIFKCIDAAGGVSFQASPCPTGSTQNNVVLHDDTSTPAPASPTDPRSVPIIQSDSRIVHNPSTPPPSRGTVSTQMPQSPRDQYWANKDDTSYECRLPNGEVFYRHDGCPATASTGSSMTHDSIRDSWSSSSNDVQVTSQPVSREEACRKMNSAGAVGREGRGRDQQISTYEKNLGHDPCR